MDLDFVVSVVFIIQVLDELLPKATGKEARVEKKRVRAEQRREREISPGSCALDPFWLTSQYVPRFR